MTRNLKAFHGVPAAAWLVIALACCCAAAHAEALSWGFGGGDSGPDARWTAERGRIEWDKGAARLHPDNGGSVVLLSPAALTLATASMKSVVLEMSGTGLQRVRIQGRRDPRGGWITLADASGPAVRSADGAVVIEKNMRVADGPIEQLRVELSFRTTGVRGLTRISVRAE